MLYRPPTRLGDLALQHIGFTCMHRREGVWLGKPGYTFRFPRHWLRSETIRLGWKWTYFTGEELKLHHGQSSDYWCIHSELCSTWWVNISLTVVSTKKLFFSFFLLVLSFFLFVFCFCVLSFCWIVSCCSENCKSAILNYFVFNLQSTTRAISVRNRFQQITSPSRSLCSWHTSPYVLKRPGKQWSWTNEMEEFPSAGEACKAIYSNILQAVNRTFHSPG